MAIVASLLQMAPRAQKVYCAAGNTENNVYGGGELTAGMVFTRGHIAAEFGLKQIPTALTPAMRQKLVVAFRAQYRLSIRLVSNRGSRTALEANHLPENDVRREESLFELGNVEMDSPGPSSSRPASRTCAG